MYLRRIFVALLILSGWLVASEVTFAADVDIEKFQYNEKGITSFDMKDYEDALVYCEDALDANPDDAIAWNGLGYIANYQKDYDMAIRYCSKAIAIDPNYAAPYNNLGFAYDELGIFDKAIECYKKALELDPKDAKDIDMCDVMGRLQRNSQSLAYLLDMAEQVADCMNREFVDLFQAQDKADQERADGKMGRWKKLYYAEQQRESDRKYREKQKAEAEAAAKAEEEKPKETRGRKKSKTLKTED